ncbi:MAG: Eco57I restriction-modification methylase domain-containing protein, partial [Promethearchaeota archaeon]
MDYKNTLKFDRNSVNKYLNLIVDLGKAGNTNEESYYRGFKEFLESFFMPKLGFSIKVGGMDKINENKPDFTVLFDDIPIAIIKAEPPTTIDIEELLEAGYTNNTKNNYDTNNDTNSKLIEDFIRYRNEYGEDISYFITNFTHIYLLEFEEVSIDQNNFENVATVGVDKKGVAKVLVKIRRGVELFRRDYGLDKWAGEGDRQRRSYDVPIVQLEQLFKSATNHLILNIDNIRGLIRQLAKLGRALKSNLYSLYSNKDKLKKLEHAVDKGEMLQQLEIRDMAGNIVGIKGGELDLEHQVLMFLFLEDIYNDFKQSIFHDVLGDYDLLFSDLITQTVIYGIFSAWINYCSKGYKPETFSKEKVADNLPYESFIRHLFWDTTGKLTPLIQNEYISKIIEVFREAQFQRVIRKKENLLTMFYSEFLKEYDRQTAKDRGIVYTPSEIVDFIIKGLDYFLETRYSKEGGIINIDPLFITDKDKGSKSKRSDIYEIADKSKYEMTKQPSVNQKVNLNVNFLDPAAGTMTFPCGLLRYAKKKFLRVYKNERAALKAFAEWIDSYFFDNMYALEILISPYVLGHLRVQMAIEELLNVKGQNYNRHNKENIGHEEERNTISKITLAADIFKRLKFYLLNTLMNPENIEHYLHNSNIRRELESGLRVRNTQKIFVIFGNPPYNVSTQNNSEWINNKIKDYKRGLKEKNLKILSDDYVKFIRFAQWKIKQSGVGIVGFITNNNYLDGAVFKEMRRSLIKTFNEIYIVNLHGNMRKNEAGNPFGIKVGVAIVFFLRTRNENEYNNLNSDLAAKSESLSPNSINELEVYNKNCK